MFGLGLGELIIIFCVALIFLGPKRLPEAGRKVGEVFRQLRDTAETVKESMTQGFEESSKPNPDPSTKDKEDESS